MRLPSIVSLVALACCLPAAAGAQGEKVVCADNVIVTSKSACSSHGGVQKPGGIKKVGKNIGKSVKKAGEDIGAEAERTPKNVEKGAKTTGHNIEEGGEAISKGAHKATHPHTYTARCKDGTTWKGDSKKKACKNHGGVR